MRFLTLSLAPLSLACVLAVGCKSGNDDGSMTWNEGNPWGTHRAAQTGAPVQPGTATTAPPATQPAQPMGNT